MGGGPQFSLGQSGCARTDGLGGFGLPVRHSGDPLVLDWGHTGDAVSGLGNDAVLVYGLTEIPAVGEVPWYQKPLFWAGVVTVIFVVLNLIFW